MTVVVGKVGGLHATPGKDLCIRRISFESKCFFLSGIGGCQRSFHICHSEIVRCKYFFYILEKVSRIVFHLIKCIKTGALIKVYIRSQRTVTHHTDRDRNRFTCRFGCRWFIPGVSGRTVRRIVIFRCYFFFLLFLFCIFLIRLYLSPIQHFGKCCCSHKKCQKNSNGDGSDLHVHNFLSMTQSPSPRSFSLPFFIHFIANFLSVLFASSDVLFFHAYSS